MSKLDDKLIKAQKKYIQNLKGLDKHNKKLIKIQSELIVLYKSIIESLRG